MINWPNPINLGTGKFIEIDQFRKKVQDVK